MDRVETTGTVWLGLTLNCCRCHDHKFDPLTQREYYQLSAYFNSIDETAAAATTAGGYAKPIISLASPEQEEKIDDAEGRGGAGEEGARELEKKLRAEQPRVGGGLAARRRREARGDRVAGAHAGGGYERERRDARRSCRMARCS